MPGGFKSEIVNYADDFVVFGRAPAAEFFVALRAIRLKLSIVRIQRLAFDTEQKGPLA